VLLLLSLAWLVAVVGTLVTLVVWNRATRRVAELYGADGNTYLRQWYSRGYGVSVIVTLDLVRTESVSVRTLIIVGAAIRAIGGLVVIAGVLRGRARILGLIADSAGQTRAAQAPTPGYPAPRAEPIPDVPFADPWPAPGSHPPAPRSRRLRSTPATTAEPGDWDAHQWDPEIQQDIERRRRKTEP